MAKWKKDLNKEIIWILFQPIIHYSVTNIDSDFDRIDFQLFLVGACTFSFFFKHITLSFFFFFFFFFANLLLTEPDIPAV